MQANRPDQLKALIGLLMMMGIKFNRLPFETNTDFRKQCPSLGLRNYSSMFIAIGNRKDKLSKVRPKVNGVLSAIKFTFTKRKHSV